MKTLDWLNYKDVGYIINDNHVSGVFAYYVIYPMREDFYKTFCLYDKSLTEKETMVDILDSWKANLLSEEYGYGSVSFEELYNNKYTKIDDLFYNNISFYSDILLYKNISQYVPFKIWYCENKNDARKLFDFLEKKALAKIKKEFRENRL